MDPKNRKRLERRQLELFLQGLIADGSLEAGERPDWRVRHKDGPDISVELTEYRPREPVAGRLTRSAVEARWHKGLWPSIDRARRLRLSLEHVYISFYFKNRVPPARKDHGQIVSGLLDLVENLVHILPSREEETCFRFWPRGYVDLLPPAGRIQCVPQEDWPELAPHFSRMSVSRVHARWPMWACPQIGAAWIAPSSKEFGRILEEKARKASTYGSSAREDLPLWLLIVCDVAHDVSSHIFPEDRDERAHLIRVIRDSQFDFDASPFAQVWLFSHFSGARVRLYPPDDTV